MRKLPQILIVEMDIPVKKRFRQTRYTYIRFRMGIKLMCADRPQTFERRSIRPLHLARNSTMHLRRTI